jgi:hypothetical protein
LALFAISGGEGTSDEEPAVTGSISFLRKKLATKSAWIAKFTF